MSAETDNKEPSTSANNDNQNQYKIKDFPVCLIVLGMAGSGKTTFVKKLQQIKISEQLPYVINLDPACKELPYPANIDIRDTVNYKEVMKQYKLGPNGGIVTALNLFSTKFNNVVDLVDKASAKHKYCIIDTPGQIEVFTWSASGTIITESLATSFPTIIIYVIDVVRSTNPITFMSNMLYACSILYKARLPFIVALNKIDIQDHDFAIEWIQNFDIFQEALDKETTYISNLTRTMSLTLDEFYNDLKVCGVSSVTGVGFGKLFDLIADGVIEYKNDYKMEYEKLRVEKFTSDKKIVDDNLYKIKHDSGKGNEIKMNSLITVLPSGSELSDVYLKHPGNESSEDDEGEENVVQNNDDEIEDGNFNNFVENRKKQQKNKGK